VGGDIDGQTSTTWMWDGARWTELHPTTPPNARDTAAAATLAGDVVVFGGYGKVPASQLPPNTTEATYLNDTWVWHSGNWTNKAVAPAPPARNGAAMASLGGHAILFGGETQTNQLADTWQWDGTAWSQLRPAQSPSGRTGAVFVTLGDKSILFGGVTGELEAARATNDTWQWDGATWSRLAPPVSPSPRAEAMAAAVRGRIVVFGGRADSGGFLDDTWEWDGATWTQLEPPSAPPPRAYGVAGAVGDTMVIAGGLGNTNPIYLVDAWLWDGTTWTLSPASGPSGPDLQGSLSCF
jgi:N-acetylneuraminic acid mutarotase